MRTHVLISPNRLTGVGVHYNIRAPEGYREQLDDLVGYKSASFSFACPCADVQNLLPDALGSDCSAWRDGIKAWEGVVNKIDIEFEGSVTSIGPLQELANRINLVWENVTFGTNAPVSVGRIDWGWETDAASTSRFGIMDEILSGGQLDLDQADTVIAIALKELAWPAVVRTATRSARSLIANVTIEALGYGELTLARRYYLYDSGAFYIDVGEKVRRLVNFAIPGRGMFIQDTGYEVEEWVDQDRLCYEIIRDDLRKVGDNPHTLSFGVYDNVTPVLSLVREIPFSFNASTNRLEGPLGYLANPRPGVLVRSAGEPLPRYGLGNSDLIYIETVEYADGEGYTVNQGRSSFLKKKLEKEGIG